MKKQFRAVINAGGRVFTLGKSSGSEQGLIRLVKEAGYGLSNIVKMEEFSVSTEKRRGKTARKY
tara:strand:- start:568 stop:759 length:192 start_codon:yes stop_codon:yes gene_type:complete